MKLTYEQLKAEFKRVLLSRNIEEKTAEECATMFADTTLSGVYSHGINRFPRFIAQLDNGDIIPTAQPTLEFSFGSIEQWDAHQGFGNLTAKRMMDRAIEVAEKNGVGIVALKNANHWMRGGSYGYQAAQKGFIGICWTNSIAVMPPWGAKECRIGTNPLIIAVPTNPITLVDMSCSMFSYGRLETLRLAGKKASVDAGFDDDGNYTREPSIVENNKRLLPMGYWKGSGLSIVLDMIATLMSNGESVASITEDKDDEYCVSQIFIAIAVEKLIDGKTKDEKLERIMNYILEAEKSDPNQEIRLPGHNLDKIKNDNLENGIPVDINIWNKILSL